MASTVASPVMSSSPTNSSRNSRRRLFGRARVAGEQCPFDHLGQVDEGEDRLVEVGDIAPEDVGLVSAEGLHGVGEHARITLRRHRRVRRGPQRGRVVGAHHPAPQQRHGQLGRLTGARFGCHLGQLAHAGRSPGGRCGRSRPGAMSVSRRTESRVAPLAQAITARASPGSGRRVLRSPTRRSSARSSAARPSSRASRSTTRRLARFGVLVPGAAGLEGEGRDHPGQQCRVEPVEQPVAERLGDQQVRLVVDRAERVPGLGHLPTLDEIPVVEDGQAPVELGGEGHRALAGPATDRRRRPATGGPRPASTGGPGSRPGCRWDGTRRPDRAAVRWPCGPPG